MIGLVVLVGRRPASVMSRFSSMPANQGVLPVVHHGQLSEPAGKETAAVDVSLILDRLNSSPIANVAIVALLVLLCVCLIALIRCPPSDIPAVLEGIAGILRAVRNPRRQPPHSRRTEDRRADDRQPEHCGNESEAEPGPRFGSDYRK